MRSFKQWAAIASLSLTAMGYAQTDTTPHTVQFVAVDKNVKLEFLDWGGSGRPMILLPGLGDTAHVFDSFAQKLALNYHVIGITPRGFGQSSVPPPEPANYSPDRLADDVVAVIEALKLDHPVLAGHSVAGEVLSDMGARHPKSVSALIYIDAGYAFALYDEAHGDLVLDAIALRNQLDRLHLGTLPRNPAQVDELLTQVQQLEAELRQRKEYLSQTSPPNPIDNPVSVAMLDGQLKFTQIPLPVLAIFNVPHSAVFKSTMENQVKAFEVQVPHARIEKISNADHYLFQSNEAEVLSDINAFMANQGDKY